MNLFTENKSEGRVSAHYVITQKEKINKRNNDELVAIPGGVIFQLVSEDYTAWHAGISRWGNKESLNKDSIGIEFVNKGFEGDYPYHCRWIPFDFEQENSGFSLMKNIQIRYKILPENVVSHADIVPTRKQNPGILFNYRKASKCYKFIRRLSKIQ